MRTIREVLADRQLSYDQAQVLINQKELREIFEQPGDSEQHWEAVEAAPVEAAPVEDGQSPQQAQISRF
jgi:hypothetical protein